MARLFIDGFEGGDFRQWDYPSIYAIAATPKSGMTGTYCLQFTCCGERYLGKNLPSRSELYVAFKYYPSDGSYSNGMCEFRNGTTVLARLTRDYATGLLVARRGTTILTTGSIPVSLSNTYLIEVYYKPHDTTGAFQVKVGGVLDINFIGDTTDGATTVDGFNIGSSTNSYYPVGYFDDVVIDDAGWIGNTKIQGLVPTANGTTNNFTASAGSNYECVDEVPGSLTDYVYSNTVGHKELYAMSNLSGDIAAVKCLSVDPYVMGYGNPDSTQLKPLVRTGGTNYQGAAKNILSLTPVRTQHIWELNPNTGVVWSEADVNGIEAGIELI